MAAAKPNPVLRRRIELGIGLASPLLDLLLAIGDRTSRLLGSEEADHVPARARPGGDSAPRGLGPRERGGRSAPRR
jgi:hypothetical protein